MDGSSASGDDGGGGSGGGGMLNGGAGGGRDRGWAHVGRVGDVGGVCRSSGQCAVCLVALRFVRWGGIFVISGSSFMVNLVAYRSCPKRLNEIVYDASCPSPSRCLSHRMPHPFSPTLPIQLLPVGKGVSRLDL